jgi:hypothetical protein
MTNQNNQPIDLTTSKPPGNVTRPVSMSMTHVPLHPCNG